MNWFSSGKATEAASGVSDAAGVLSGIKDMFQSNP